MGASELAQAAKTVLLADNHPIFRAGIRALIEEQDGYEVVGEVSDGETCIAQAELLRPDILVVDLSMPPMDGFEVARWARKQLPAATTIILTMYSGKEFVAEAKEAGARAFVSKEDAGSELIAALGQSAEFYMSSSAGRAEPTSLAPAAEDIPKQMLPGLSRAEMNVLKSVAQSKTSREISEVLGISVRTVQTHRRNICEKLELRGSNSLLQFAIRNRQLIEESD